MGRFQMESSFPLPRRVTGPLLGSLWMFVDSAARALHLNQPLSCMHSRSEPGQAVNRFCRSLSFESPSVQLKLMGFCLVQCVGSSSFIITDPRRGSRPSRMPSYEGDESVACDPFVTLGFPLPVPYPRRQWPRKHVSRCNQLSGRFWELPSTGLRGCLPCPWGMSAPRGCRSGGPGRSSD